MNKYLLSILILGIFMSMSSHANLTHAQERTFQVLTSKLQASNKAEILVNGAFPEDASGKFTLSPSISIQKIDFLKTDVLGQTRIIVESEHPFRLDTHYYLTFPNGEKYFLQPDGILDELYSDKPLGYNRENGQLVFRLFAPRALSVRLVVFEKHDDSHGKSFGMKRDVDGVWEYFADEDWTGKYYGYRVAGPTGEGEIFDSTLVLADPYSPAVVSQNHYTHPSKTLILPEDNFDWENTAPLKIPHQDLAIYEMHVRDLTMHPTSGVDEDIRGSYLGLVQSGKKGGIDYIKKLGVNTVELLPIHDFGNIEVPFRDSDAPVYNTWNPYARNHWGYMTSYFFAPESYYASGGNMTPGDYNGQDGRQVNEFKTLVREFHKAGIAVVIDVVYNHVSQYDYNPFKYIDKFYYFRLNEDCSFRSASGCGNDFKTERPMARRMILESVKHWMTEYQVDGFRFDLAAMIDRETCEQIYREARAINPEVILIAEPWGGGGYNPGEFSDIGWAAWNDQIRNGIKGWNPLEDRGFAFGQIKRGTNRQNLENYMMGTLREHGGIFNDVRHSVNYLESHDDHTLGDFIRLALGEVNEHTRISDVDAHAKLTKAQLKLNKLAAMALLTSQGPVMLHSGQEYARSKIIHNTTLDSAWGHIDHNSYEKDDETNWLNFDHATLNESLFSYHQGLLDLRQKYRAFRYATPGNFKFSKTTDTLLLVYTITLENERVIVALNGNPHTSRSVKLPKSETAWQLLADAEKVYNTTSGENKTYKSLSSVKLPSSSGMILVEKR